MLILTMLYSSNINAYYDYAALAMLQWLSVSSGGCGLYYQPISSFAVST
jgi:hypothetical protein